MNADLDLPSSELVYIHEATGKFVYSDRPVALCGVEKHSVVIANDRAKICRNGMNQLVKNVVDENIAGK